MSNAVETLRELMKTGVLGINANTKVTLSYNSGEDVIHSNGDYQERVFAQSGLFTLLTELLASGADAKLFKGQIAEAIGESEYIEREGYFVDSNGTKYSLSEAIAKLDLLPESSEDYDEDEAWDEVSSQLTFVPDDITQAVAYDSYSFGIDTSLEQYDYKRGFFSVSLTLETKLEDMLSSAFDFGQFTIELDTKEARLTLK